MLGNIILAFSLFYKSLLELADQSSQCVLTSCESQLMSLAQANTYHGEIYSV